MPIDAEDIDDGVSGTASDILGRYTDAADINESLFGDFMGLNIDEDVEDLLQTHTINNTEFWDGMYAADPADHTEAALSDFLLGYTSNTLDAQKGLNLTITNSVKTLTTTTVSIEQAFVQYFEGVPAKVYVEKATGTFVTSETVLSETTHIPYGKYLAGAGKVVEAWAVFETFKDTIISSYNATTGQEDTFSPLHNYLVAATTVLVGGAVTAWITGPALIALVGGSLAGAGAGWIADTLIGNLPQLVTDAKAESKTLEQTLDEAYDEIVATVNEFWGATGATADDILDDAQDILDDFMDGVKDLVPDLDLPAATLPSWVPDFLTPWDDSKDQASPLIIDLDGDGVEATAFNAATTKTLFDLNSDGFAEQTAWVGAHDGLLVRDLNENGIIDNGSELFGSPTIDGFALLAQLDSNGDLLVNASDADWSDLLIWNDSNGDAVTQNGEMHALSYYSITSINLSSVAASSSTVNGNPISHTSTVMKNGSTAAIADVWFVYDHMNTTYQGDYELDARVLFLPTLRGFGKVADLHIAMSNDSDLLALMEDFVLDVSSNGFVDVSSVNDDFKEILLTWAGVEDVTAGSRGPNFDAKVIEFLEQYVGEEWWLLGNYSQNPQGWSVTILNGIWEDLSTVLRDQVLVQILGNTLFEDLTYNAWTAEFDGSLALSEDAINSHIALSTDTGVDTEQYWANLAMFLDSVKGFGGFTLQEDGWMDAAIQTADAGLSWDGIKELVGVYDYGTTVNGTSGNDTLSDPVFDSDDTLNGYDGNDTITASFGHDEVHGGNGTDTIYGGLGNDTLYGDAGNDVIDGGDGHDFIDGGSDADTITGGIGNDYIYGNSGNDTISGGAGDEYIQGDAGNDRIDPGLGGNIVLGGDGGDTYVYSGGYDLYTENYSGTDVIEMPTGITLSDLTFSRLGPNAMLITVAGYGTIQLTNQIDPPSSDRFETILFSDTTTLNLLTYSGSLTTHGTNGNDNLDGVTTGAGTNDTIYGYGGNDDIEAKAGNDTVDGGAGNDTINLGDGNDTLIASPGFDTVSVLGGTDTLLIPVGYDMDDVELVRLGSSPNHLMVTITGLGQIQFTNHFYGSGNVLDYIQLASGGSPISVSSLSIATVGSDSADSLTESATNANDIMFGRGGNDTITAAGGNDTVDGGDGNDTIYTYGGDDIVYFSNGTDWILESTYSSNVTGDTIRFHAGVDPGTISVYRDAANTYWGGLDSLTIADGTGNTLGVYGHFWGGGYKFETIEFEGGPTWTLSTMQVETRGTSSGETLTGITAGASTNDVIYGYGGNDTLNGGSGNDELYGGAGTDSLTGSTGADTFVFEIASAFSNQDTIADFNAGSGDKVDVHDVIDLEFDHLTEAISQFMDFTNSGGNSIMSIDRDGTGTTYGFVNVATLTGVTNLDETTLYNNGNLLAA